MRALVLFAPLLVACGPNAATGEIDGVPFDRIRAAWFGDNVLIVSDAPLDCTQVGWVSDNYVEGPSVAPLTFTALQFTFDDGIPVGTFLADRSQGVEVDALVNTRDALVVHHAREGTVDVLAAEPTVDGTFSIAFGAGGVAGEFVAKSCLNLNGI
jgi:hypothetical protein